MDRRGLAVGMMNEDKRDPGWRARADATPNAYMGAYCCERNVVDSHCPDHPDWGSAPGAMLDLRRAHGLRWDDLPSDMVYGAAVSL